MQSFAMATEDDYGAANGADLMDGTPRIAQELTSRKYKVFQVFGPLSRSTTGFTTMQNRFKQEKRREIL